MRMRHYHLFTIAASAALFLLSALPLLGADFNPYEALKFLETMSTLDRNKPNLNILAQLYKVRKAVGLHKAFVEDAEWFVCAGAVAAGRGDLYYKTLKNGCVAMKSEDFEYDWQQLPLERFDCLLKK